MIILVLLFLYQGALALDYQERAQVLLSAKSIDDVQVGLKQKRLHKKCEHQLLQSKVPDACYQFNQLSGVKKLDPGILLNSCLRAVETQGYAELRSQRGNLLPAKCRNATAVRIKELEYLMAEQKPSYYIKSF